MSAIPQGAVPISFAADRSQIDAYLAELRQGYTIPIRAQYEGPRASAGVVGPESPSSAAASGGFALPSIDTTQQQSAMRALRAELVSLREEYEATSAAAKSLSASSLGTSRTSSRPTIGQQEQEAAQSIAQLPTNPASVLPPATPRGDSSRLFAEQQAALEAEQGPSGAARSAETALRGTGLYGTTGRPTEGYSAFEHEEISRFEAEAGHKTSILPSSAADFTTDESAYTTLVGTASAEKAERKAPTESAEERAVLRQRSQRAKQVDNNWDRAQLAEQKAEEAAERKAAKVAAGVEAEAEEAAPGRRGLGAQQAGESGGNRILGLRPGRLAQLATVGFIATEGLRVVQEVQKSSMEQALARTPLEAARAQLQTTSLLTRLPIVGQIADIATYSQRLAAEQAFRGADEGQKDLGATVQRNERTLQRRTQISANEYEAQRIGIHSSYNRRGQQILDEQSIREEQFHNQAETLSQQITAESDPYQKNRLTQEYNRLVREQPAVLASEKKRDDADITELKRQYGRAIVSRGGYTAPLRSAAEGRFGEAREREFQRSLDQEEADAGEVSPRFQKIVHDQNFIKRQGENAGITLDIQRRQADTSAISSELGRDSLSAEIKRIKSQADYESHFARPLIDPLTNGSDGGAADRTGIQQRAEAEIALAKQNNTDAFSQQEGRLRARTESLNILTDQTKGTPYSRRLASDAFTIKNDALLAARETFLRKDITPEQKQTAMRSQYEFGGVELKALQQNYAQGIRPAEVDINRTATGVGTENPTEAMKEIANGIAELKDLMKNVPTTLGQIRDGLAGLVAGP